MSRYPDRSWVPALVIAVVMTVLFCLGLVFSTQVAGITFFVALVSTVRVLVVLIKNGRTNRADAADPSDDE